MDERSSLITARLATGDTLEEIGQTLGITSERVRQIAQKVGIVGGGFKIRMSLRRAERAKAYAEECRRVESLGRVCATCDRPMPAKRLLTRKGKRITCGPKCARLWLKVRFKKSPEHKQRAYRRNARWYLAHPKHPWVNVSQLRWAAKILGRKGPPVTMPGASRSTTERWKKAKELGHNHL